jgi:small subunit ribosomal protein S4e
MSKHMKRLNIPRVWSLPKKSHVWATRSSPGPHPIDRSIPLLVIVRDMLNYCDTEGEGRRIIGNREVNIDGRVVTDHKLPVGFMDVLSIPRTKEHFRTLLDPKGKLRVMKIPKENSGWKLARIENISYVKGAKKQLNLHDGRNILIEKGQKGEYKTGDVLKIELPSQKILTTYPMKKGNVAMIIGGKHAGQIAKIKDYKVTRSPKPNIVGFEEGFSTIKDHVFVVGKTQPEIKVPEVSVI